MLSLNKTRIGLLFDMRITENRFYDKEISPGRHIHPILMGKKV